MKNLLQTTLAVTLVFVAIIALLVVPDERLGMHKFLVLLIGSKIVFALCLWGAWRIYKEGDTRFFN